MLEQRAPRRILVDDVPADWIVLEQEPVQAVAIVHDGDTVKDARLAEGGWTDHPPFEGP